MTSRPPRSAEETRMLLVEAGMALLRELTGGRLISAVGTRAIAQRAGVSGATLFHHFGSTEAYATALLARVFDASAFSVPQVNEKVGALRGVDLPLMESLEMHRSEFRRMVTDDEHKLRLGLWAFGGAEAATAYGHFMRTVDDAIASTAAGLFASWGREFRPPFDLSTFLALQAALLSGSVIRHRADPAAIDSERFSRAASAVSAVVLRAPGDRRDVDDRLAEEVNLYGQGGRGRPTRPAVGEQTRDRIRAAAAETFEHMGFEQATVADVAARAHVSVSTVYALFKSKAGLGVAVLLDGAASLDATARPGEDPADGLVRRLSQVAHLLVVHREQTAAYLTMTVTLAPLPDPDPLRGALVELVGAGRSSGALRTGSPDDELADALLLVLAARVVSHPSARPADVTRYVLRTCVDGWWGSAPIAPD